MFKLVGLAVLLYFVPQILTLFHNILLGVSQ